MRIVLEKTLEHASEWGLSHIRIALGKTFEHASA